MMTTRLVTLLLTISSNLALGQEVVKEYYSKYDIKVSPEDSYYYKVGKKIVSRDSEKAHKRLDTIYVDSVKTYYTKNNVLRSRLFYIDGFPEGDYVNYYEDGRVKEKGTYEEGRRIGRELSWHRNGNLHKEFNYILEEWRSTYKIIHYWDSLGNQLVKNGEGDCKCFLSNDSLREEGNVTNGVRNGLWKTFHRDVLRYNDQFLEGEFKGGENYYKGETFRYTKIEEMAEFPGGIPNMMNFLKNNVAYPKQARKQKIEGRVFVKFIVEKDGTINNIEILKGVESTLDDEARRAILMMPKWIPGKQRGVPVRSQFVLPVYFKLG